MIFSLALGACGQAQQTTSEVVETAQPTAATEGEAQTETTGSEPTVITLMTHDSFNVSEEVIAAFEVENKAKVELLPSGDAGAALNQAILSKNNPLADVFFGVDNTFLGRALKEDIFEPYQSPLLADVPDALELDPDHRLLPVDFGDVCLNYDKAWFAEQGLEPPDSLEDLADPAYKGLTVVENPATSSPGLAFLLTTVSTFGEDGYLDYWTSLRENDVMVVNGWEDAYWGQFSAASDGLRPLVVSYASSPPAEVYFAEEPPEEAPTAAVTSDGTCFRQIEFIGILKGTKNRALAEKLIDFMLGQSFQEDIPLQMFVFPANEKAALPEVFTKYTTIPANPASISPAVIDSNREAWLEAWTQTVLQ
jgi:thiamine transport system substrate-binding protein